MGPLGLLEGLLGKFKGAVRLSALPPRFHFYPLPPADGDNGRGGGGEGKDELRSGLVSVPFPLL